MYLYLVAIAWVYVVLLMSMTEASIIAGVMTFLLYCAFPLSVVLYVMGTPQRKRKRMAAEKLLRESKATEATVEAPATSPAD